VKVAVVGCGAMGSIYAGRFALAGHEVWAIDRNAAHVAAMRERGLRLRGPDGEVLCELVASTDVPEQVMDLVVIATKGSGAGAAARASLPMIDGSTVVVTIQNGVGPQAQVAEVVGAGHLVVGIASGFGASRPAPGVVAYNAMRAMLFGPYDGLPSATLDELVQWWVDAGFTATGTADIAVPTWEKLICNCAYSAIALLTGCTVGEVLADGGLQPLSAAVARETDAVARALGVALGDVDPVDRAARFAAQMPAAKPSALLDHEVGRRSEIGQLNGAVVAAGTATGTPTPMNAMLVALVDAREARLALR
jgi:2-dehydropantoate 2-reductase